MTMKMEDDTMEATNLVLLLVRAMVAAPDGVSVSSSLSSSGSTIIQIKVPRGNDMGKVIGRQGRTAQSLRVIVQAIGRERGKDYKLDIEESSTDTK